MAYVYKSGSLGDIACAPGQHPVCALVRPGQDPASAPCTCQDDRSVTDAAGAAVNHHWGLIAGLAVAAVVLYKVAF